MGEAFKLRNGYNPSLLAKIYIILGDQLFSLWLLIKVGAPFLWDIFKTNVLQSKGKRLPSNIQELLDPKMFSRLAKRKVEKVEYSTQLEQHAKSTDRAWLRVKYADEKDDTYVFAKVHARTFLVRAIMSMFDVYRNELHAYSCLKMPVLIPKVHIATWTSSRFCLAMEDLRHEKVQFPNLWETTVDKSLAKQVLSTLAHIHAHFWNNCPDGAWKGTKRPHQAGFMGMATLHVMERRCPELISKDAHDLFMTALWHWDKVQGFFRRSTPKTMVHGDTHMGNFFITQDGKVGTFDFQVKSEEHPMRDVTYFLSCSYPKEKLAEDERELISYYLEQLEGFGVPKAEVPTFEQCWQQYRLQCFYTLYAFVFSGGFADLMDQTQSRFGISRILEQMRRVDAAGALYDLLDGKL